MNTKRIANVFAVVRRCGLASAVAVAMVASADAAFAETNVKVEADIAYAKVLDKYCPDKKYEGREGSRKCLEDNFAKVSAAGAGINGLKMAWQRQEEVALALLAVAERLANTDPSNSLWQVDLAELYRDVGHAREGLDRDLPGALQAYRAEQAILERLAKSDPSNPKWQEDLAKSYFTVAHALSSLNKLPEALQAYRDCIAIAEPLARADHDSKFQGGLAVVHGDFGRVLERQGSLPEALKAYRDSLAIRVRLSGATPDYSNNFWQGDIASTHSNIGGVLQAQGDLPEALKAYRDSLAIFERLASTPDPHSNSWPFEVTRSYEKVGGVLLAQGNLPEALTAFRAQQAAAERNGRDRTYLEDAYSNIGDVLAAQGSLPEALQAYRDSLAIFERRASMPDPSDYTVGSVMAIYSKLGQLHVKMGNKAEALRLFTAGRAVAAPFAERSEYQRVNKYLKEFDAEIAALGGKL
jgi:tetratricopeptide (TPR) repeat protein